uniref:Uncharacterized protein n=1 Tax=Arundo donax TaxID=35708 RepID=A0A0A8Y7W1_ARUDO
MAEEDPPVVDVPLVALADDTCMDKFTDQSVVRRDVECGAEAMQCEGRGNGAITRDLMSTPVDVYLHGLDIALLNSC